MMVFEEKRLRSASVWVIDALKSAATGPLSPRTRRRALKKQRKTVSKLNAVALWRELRLQAMCIVV